MSASEVTTSGANPLYLLDTNIVIHCARRDDSVGERIKRDHALLTTPITPLISFVTEAEAASFAAQNKWGASQQEQLGFFLSAFRSIAIHSPGIKDAYVSIDVYSRRVGRRMGKNDLWIAATAHVTSATLLTADADFNHLDGVFLNRIQVLSSLGSVTDLNL